MTVSSVVPAYGQVIAKGHMEIMEFIPPGEPLDPMPDPPPFYYYHYPCTVNLVYHDSPFGADARMQMNFLIDTPPAILPHEQYHTVCNGILEGSTNGTYVYGALFDGNGDMLWEHEFEREDQSELVYSTAGWHFYRWERYGLICMPYWN